MPAIIHCDAQSSGGGLIALALHKARPNLDVRIAESGGTLGGTCWN